MVCIAAASGTAACGQNGIAEIQKSHIDGNVPEAGVFDAYLLRDLEAYFAADGMSKPTVKYTLFRKEPTQSGVAFPKYYAWLSAVSDAGDVRIGAVRLAAVDRTAFEVTDFMRREDILANLDALARVFPAALLPAIRERAATPSKD